MPRPASNRAIALLLVLAPAVASGQPHVTGRWSPAFEMGGVALHSTLLRGPGDAWRVTWWSGFDGWNVRTWDYRPGPFDTVTSFAPRVVHPTPDNFYECGFAPIADGRLLTLGGLVRYSHDGSERSVTFDPLTGASAQTARLKIPRYEPSLTPLPDGRVLVAGGIRYIYAAGFGGRSPRPGAPLEFEARKDMLRLALHPVPEWRDSTDDGWGSAVRPPPLELHSAVNDADGGGRMLVFGGRDDTAPSGPTVVNDRVWRLSRFDEDLTREVVWTWDTVTTQADPAHGRPAGRWAHSAALTADRRMVVFGGRDAAGALADTWTLSLAVPFGVNPSWKRLSPAPDPAFGAPGARWGHAVVYDAQANRLLVFGGRHAGGFVTDDCWELSLGVSPAWRKLADSGQPREGHSATFSSSGYRRVWVFGGRSPAGHRQDVREFRLDLETWRSPTFAPGGPFPPARAGHAAYLNPDQVLVVSGGELADGTLDERIWRLPFVLPFFESSQLAWVQDPPGSFTPGPRAGHTLVVQDRNVTSRRFEIYDPNGEDGGEPGSTVELPASARRFVYFYPPMFVLPGGHLLHGAGGATAMLDLASATWTPVPGGALGGTAGQVIQYAPGRMMRCGGNSRSHITDVAVFDASDQTTGWSPWTLGQMRRRILHRATVMPTGEVLVTGGVKDPSDEVGQRIPQLWNEVTGWGDSTVLAPEPALRGYHGTAILLPDGRVLTTGGSSAGPDPFRGCVFEPPYLFDAAGGYVRQSVLVGVPPSASHGQDLAVTLEEPGDAPAIAAAALIRPSAATHDPNFTQLRVPLSFTRTGDVLHLALPVSPNVAPPGDYLLFVLRDSSGVQVPSIASWLRLTLPDAIAPDVPTGLTGTQVGADTQLRWARNSEPDLARYRLYRGASAGFTPAPANLVGTPTDTFFTDVGQTGHWYKLSAEDVSGNESAHAVLSPDEVLAAGGRPGGRPALRTWPNPARGELHIAFTMPRPARARLAIHDAAGRTVRALVHAELEAGAHSARWDGRDGAGRTAAPGRYFVRLESDGGSRSRPFTLRR